MITKEQVESLELGIIPINQELCLLVESALDWIKENTSIKVNTSNLQALQANVRLFITQYIDIMKLPNGISSESVSGLSQSFDTKEKSDMLLSLARATLGEENVLAGMVRFVSSTNRWE